MIFNAANVKLGVLFNSHHMFSPFPTCCTVKRCVHSYSGGKSPFCVSEASSLGLFEYLYFSNRLGDEATPNFRRDMSL